MTKIVGRHTVSTLNGKVFYQNDGKFDDAAEILDEYTCLFGNDYLQEQNGSPSLYKEVNYSVSTKLIFK